MDQDFIQASLLNRTQAQKEHKAVMRKYIEQIEAMKELTRNRQRSSDERDYVLIKINEIAPVKKKQKEGEGLRKGDH